MEAEKQTIFDEMYDIPENMGEYSRNSLQICMRFVDWVTEMKKEFGEGSTNYFLSVLSKASLEKKNNGKHNESR